MFELAKMAISEKQPELMVGMIFIFEIIMLPFSILGLVITKLLNRG